MISFCKKYKNSFQCYWLRHYFKILFYIKIIHLINNITTLLSFIKTREDVDLKALHEANRKKPKKLKYKIFPSKVRVDGQKLIMTCTIMPQTFVHCKCVILLYILFYLKELFLNYIEISKLSCHGYFQAISSVNLSNKMRIYIKICHHK